MKQRTRKSPSASAPGEHILVPFDFSDGAKLALEHAIRHARQVRARLTLLHIVHLPYLGSGFGPGEGIGAEDAYRADASRKLAAIARKAERQGVPARAVVRIGHPASDVVALARDERVDLIILGTHGRTGLRHVLLGSVAEGVVRHAPCTVVVARDRERQSK